MPLAEIQMFSASRFVAACLPAIVSAAAGMVGYTIATLFPATVPTILVATTVLLVIGVFRLGQAVERIDRVIGGGK